MPMVVMVEPLLMRLRMMQRVEWDTVLVAGEDASLRAAPPLVEVVEVLVTKEVEVVAQALMVVVVVVALVGWLHPAPLGPLCLGRPPLLLLLMIWITAAMPAAVLTKPLRM